MPQGASAILTLHVVLIWMYRSVKVRGTAPTKIHPKKQKAHLAAGLRGEKAPRPLRGGRQNSFLGRSLVRGTETSQAGKGTF